ncbi:MAG: LytTR family DNA-binding domain-containing protein [Gemmatimonadales bacterium]
MTVPGDGATLRALVVDDEPIVRRDLERLLSRHPDVEVVGTAADGVSALAAIDRLLPDVVFLDVQMPELDGLSVVDALDPDAPPLVVFVTAFDQYAIHAFDADAVDYLLKPFDADRLARALDRIRERRRLKSHPGSDRLMAAASAARPPSLPGPARLAVRTADRVVIVDLAEVRWIEAAGNYARLHLADRAYLTRRTMRDLEATLGPAGFVRVHRSHLVALRFVRELQSLGDGDYELRLDNGVRLVVTRSYRAALEARLGGVA